MNCWILSLRSAISEPLGLALPATTAAVWPDVIGSGLLALAFFGITAVLVSFIRQRRDLPFRRIALLLSLFLVACGVVPLLGIRAAAEGPTTAAGWGTLVTALIALGAVAALVRALPAALQLPAPDALRRLNDQLEERVRARTAGLTDLNERLRHEIDQRERAEDEVRRLNGMLEQRVDELQTLFDLLPVGVGIATDSSCAVIQTNRALADMLGLPPDHNASLAAPTPDAPHNFKVLQGDHELTVDELPMQRAARENIALLNFEETIVRNDGTAFEVLVHAVPMRTEYGDACGCVATFQDVTAQRRAERERREFELRLQETRKLESIGVLAGGIAHDFNNLLTGILGNAGLVRRELPETAKDARELLSSVETAALRAADLCRQLLAYAGKGRFLMQPLDLSAVVEQSSTLLKLSIAKKIALRLALDASLPHCRADASQIRQVLINLVTNASEAIGDADGIITVSTRRFVVTPENLRTLVPGHTLVPGECVSLEIADNGPGIPTEMVARIFEPFFTTKFIGRGLGLPAVLGIVRGHRGGVAVSSQPGRGTTVQVLFPATPAAAATPETVRSAPATAAKPPLLAAGTVLVVDDDDSVRHLAARALTEAGFQVVTACDGQEALNEARERGKPFDAVLLDMMMPRMDGEDTLVALRLITPDVPVVLISGFSEQSLADRFIGRGRVDFLPKPFSAEQLVTRIRSIITESATPAPAPSASTTATRGPGVRTIP